ncbi:MAG: TerD family protein [Pseudomonadota bacterium]|nr:TerD family protein [Pseudomonadota bacterium]
MPVSLTRGQQVALYDTPEDRPNRVIMGLGWDARRPGFLRRLLGMAEETDLDASCLMLDESGQLVDVAWFRQLRSKDGSVVHTGDNRTGGSEGDDEQIFVDLDKVPAAVRHLFFVVSCFTGQTLSRISNAYCRLVDARTRKEVARYGLSDFGDYTACVLARLYRDGEDWRMQACGEGSGGYTPAQVMPAVRRLLKRS